MKKMLFLAAFAFANISLMAQTAPTKWTVDNVHSNVKFTVTHLVISEVEGNFKVYDGSITGGKPDFSDAKIDFTIDVASINTDNEMRDNHLKSADFFDVEKFPKATFQSTSFKNISGNKYELKGNLTMHGITKPVTFNVTYGGSTKDGYGNTKVGFKASTTINRFDYGLNWNMLTEAGGTTVGKEVAINLNLQFTQQKVN